jgi:hypothetical protein
MGTRGYYAICYKGVYYVWYNHFDSYISGLGYEIAADWRKLTPEDIEELKKNLETIDDRDDDLVEKTDFSGLSHSASSVRPNSVEMKEPTIDLFIEYVYIVNLDKETFKVKYTEYDSNEVCVSKCRLSKLSKEFLEDLLVD